MEEFSDLLLLGVPLSHQLAVFILELLKALFVVPCVFLMFLCVFMHGNVGLGILNCQLTDLVLAFFFDLVPVFQPFEVMHRIGQRCLQIREDQRLALGIQLLISLCDSFKMLFITLRLQHRLVQFANTLVKLQKLLSFKQNFLGVFIFFALEHLGPLH